MKVVLRFVAISFVALVNVLFFGGLADASTPWHVVKPVNGRVVRVVDGDTLVVSGVGTVRLIGVDTPETVKPHTPVQCGGREASGFTKSLAEGQRVSLSFDGVAGRKDRYGRTLAYVWVLSGRNVEFLNYDLIYRGYGREYDFAGQAYRYRSVFQRAERSARARGVGVWGAC